LTISKNELLFSLELILVQSDGSIAQFQYDFEIGLERKTFENDRILILELQCSYPGISYAQK
jgi:hypothetical protein